MFPLAFWQWEHFLTLNSRVRRPLGAAVPTFPNVPTPANMEGQYIHNIANSQKSHLLKAVQLWGYFAGCSTVAAASPKTALWP
jgi:hypothetical protein